MSQLNFGDRTGSGAVWLIWPITPTFPKNGISIAHNVGHNVIRASCTNVIHYSYRDFLWHSHVLQMSSTIIRTMTRMSSTIIRTAIHHHYSHPDTNVIHYSSHRTITQQCFRTSFFCHILVPQWDVFPATPHPSNHAPLFRPTTQSPATHPPRPLHAPCLPHGPLGSCTQSPAQ